MFSWHMATQRSQWWQSLMRLLLIVLMGKVLVSILLEYVSYFPPNFDSAFLTGREDSFTPLYATAFYTHLIGGPLALVLGAALMASGGKVGKYNWHRWVGRVQLLIVLFALVPSSLVMATEALAGPIAGVGFAMLTLATGYTAAAAAYFAYSRQFVVHRRWANRCFVLLVSPLILRLVSGLLTVTNMESPAAYRWNAWLSWLVPLLIYEVVWRWQAAHGAPPVRTAVVQTR